MNEPNYSDVQSGSLSPLRAAPLEEAGIVVAP